MQANERGLMPCLCHLGIEDMHIGPAKSVKHQFQIKFLSHYFHHIRLLNHLVKGSVG